MALRKFSQNDNNLAFAYYRFSSDIKSSVTRQNQCLSLEREESGTSLTRTPRPSSEEYSKNTPRVYR